MLVATAELMREMDRLAMAEGGMPGVVLMENAGAAAARCAKRMLRGKPCARVHVACGPGNNGGDGFVAARHLALAGYAVTLELAADPARLQSDAATHYRCLNGLAIGQEAPSRPPDLVLDCLLGTGARGTPRGRTAHAVERIQAWGCPVLAVDLPTGLDADTGAAPGSALTATRTLALALPKLGMFLGRGPDLCGEVEVSPIGWNWARYAHLSPYSLTDRATSRRCWPPRERTAHKGDFGHLLVIGGSGGMSGAPIMSGLAALRSGAGLVTVATPAASATAALAASPALMAAPQPDEAGSLDERCLAAVQDRHTAVALGPGLGRAPGAVRLVQAMLAVAGAPLLLDADALHALAALPGLHPPRTCLLTPHAAEAGRLLSVTAAEVNAAPIAAVREIARRYGAVVILKGNPTLVCDGRAVNSEPLAVVNTGTAALATAGSGDVLSGVAGALLARGVDPWEAGQAAAWVHGMAGRHAARRLGAESVTAMDVIKGLAPTLADLERNEA